MSSLGAGSIDSTSWAAEQHARGQVPTGTFKGMQKGEVKSVREEQSLCLRKPINTQIARQLCRPCLVWPPSVGLQSFPAGHSLAWKMGHPFTEVRVTLLAPKASLLACVLCCLPLFAPTEFSEHTDLSSI